MKVQTQVDTRELSQTLARASQVLGKGVGELVKRHSPPAIMEMMRVFPPMNNTSGREAFGKQRRLGNAAVERDIRDVYVSLGTVVEDVNRKTGEADEGAGRAVAKAIRRGNTSEAIAILNRVGFPVYSRMEMGHFDPSHHRRSRDRRGRVRRRRQAQIVIRASDINRYIREQKKKVGFLKSGFYRGYRAGGGSRSVPRWITQHASRTGRVRDQSRKRLNPSFTVINTVNYASQHDQGLVRMVLRRTRGRMIRGLKAATRRKLRQARVT